MKRSSKKYILRSPVSLPLIIRSASFREIDGHRFQRAGELERHLVVSVVHRCAHVLSAVERFAASL
jgi:hypothetical protein